jgi:RecJ-like exonuclease
MRNKQLVIKYTDNDDNEISLSVPAKNQICDNCEGDGKMDHPAFSNGITQSERQEMGEEDFQSYMEGAYDVPCDCCQGRGMILVADVNGMTFIQKRFAVKVRRYEREQAEFERQYAAERAAEMRFCGYY